MESRINNLEKENELLKTDIENLKKQLNESNTKPPKKVKVSRLPSAYNKFMATKITELKKADPNLDHKKAFSLAVDEWKIHKSKTLDSKV